MKYLILIIFCCQSTFSLEPIFQNESRFHPVVAKHGMVASQEKRATESAVQVLKEGGNAIDAAVTLAFSLAVTLPRAGNLGGGGFMIIHYEGKNFALDFREKAPLLASRDMFLDKDGEHDRQASMFSYKAIGVPGTVAGLAAVHKRFGSLPWERTIRPAIEMAREGILVRQEMEQALKRAEKDFLAYEDSKKIFTRNGETLKRGSLLIQTDLADTLEKIARHGASAMYRGSIAGLIVRDMQSNGGLIKHDDLAKYKPVWRDPIRGEFQDHTLITMPPPSSGGIHLIQILSAFEALPAMERNSAGFIHFFAETARRSYADRSKYLGDPDFNKIPVNQLLDKSYLENRFSTIQKNKATPSGDVLPGDLNAFFESPQTTHFSVADKSQNMVSCTTTLNFSYGMRAVARGTGILYNNQMDDFSSKPGSPNAYGLIGSEFNSIAPEKRMLSSMTPVIVIKDGKAVLATGSPGGSRIITTVAQFLIGHLKEQQNIAVSTSAVRIHHQWVPDILYHEQGLSLDTRVALESFGHVLKETRAMGSLQSVSYKNGLFYGSSDPRKPGGAAIGLD